MKVKKGLFKKIEEVEFQGKKMFLCYPPELIGAMVGLSGTLVKDPIKFERSNFGSIYPDGQIWLKNKKIGVVSDITKIKEVQLEEE